jgi:hypothetical protein
MTGPASQIPGPADRAVLNAALHATGADTGFWDDHGHPAPWPDDIDKWRPATGEPITRQPGEQPL